MLCILYILNYIHTIHDFANKRELDTVHITLDQPSFCIILHHAPKPNDTKKRQRTTGSWVEWPPFDNIWYEVVGGFPFWIHFIMEASRTPSVAWNWVRWLGWTIRLASAERAWQWTHWIRCSHGMRCQINPNINPNKAWTNEEWTCVTWMDINRQAWHSIFQLQALAKMNH